MIPVIVFDFDGTLTECPGVWRVAMEMFKDRGYRVICVTQRVADEENIDIIESWMEEENIHMAVYYTGGYSKLGLLGELGIVKYIMIDDDMKAAVNGK